MPGTLYKDIQVLYHGTYFLLSIKFAPEIQNFTKNTFVVLTKIIKYKSPLNIYAQNKHRIHLDGLEGITYT